MTTSLPTTSQSPAAGDPLQLNGEVGRLPADLTGTWAPASANLSNELPRVIAELHRRGVRIYRIAYNPRRWDPAPRSLAADGRTVHLGLFRTLEPDLLILQGSAGERVDLSVPSLAGGGPTGVGAGR
jgi:hypothetical protein